MVDSSVQRHYTAYIRKGGDGVRVLEDRGRELGYVDEQEDELFAAFCGSGCPLRWAELRPGETVVDLGCGAGHDVVLASRLVGAGRDAGSSGKGRAIGVDLTPAMLEAARANVEKYHNPQTDGEIEFFEARFDDPNPNQPLLAPKIADGVISNGVFNLCSNKTAAFRTAYALLKPGGRFVLSDLCKVPVEAPNAAVC